MRLLPALLLLSLAAPLLAQDGDPRVALDGLDHHSFELILVGIKDREPGERVGSKVVFPSCPLDVESVLAHLLSEPCQPVVGQLLAALVHDAEQRLVVGDHLEHLQAVEVELALVDGSHNGEKL